MSGEGVFYIIAFVFAAIVFTLLILLDSYFTDRRNSKVDEEAKKRHILDNIKRKGVIDRNMNNERIVKSLEPGEESLEYLMEDDMCVGASLGDRVEFETWSEELGVVDELTLQNRAIPKLFETWQHFKGGIYEVFGIAYSDYIDDDSRIYVEVLNTTDGDTLQSIYFDTVHGFIIKFDDQKEDRYVLYKSKEDSSKLYARGLAEFMSEVEHDKYPDVEAKYRFVKL